jgi:hypothetical protein
MKWKIATAVSSAVAICLLCLLLASSVFRHFFGIRGFEPITVVTEIKRLNQLVTVRYSIQRVVGLREQKVPIGEESILLLVQGEAQAGINLDTLKPNDIRRTGPNSVQIKLPVARLLNVFLDEKQTQVWDRQITWWTPWVAPDPDLEHKARIQALEDVRNAAMKMGILQQAETNAQTSIRDLLAGLQISATFSETALD